MAVLVVEAPVPLTIAILLPTPFGVWPLFFANFLLSLPDLVVGAIPKGVTAKQRPTFRSAGLLIQGSRFSCSRAT